MVSPCGDRDWCRCRVRSVVDGHGTWWSWKCDAREKDSSRRGQPEGPDGVAENRGVASFVRPRNPRATNNRATNNRTYTDRRQRFRFNICPSVHELQPYTNDNSACEQATMFRPVPLKVLLLLHGLCPLTDALPKPSQVPVTTRRELSSAGCREHADCASCTNGGSLFGGCRWCPGDQQCHEMGAVSTNQCHSFVGSSAEWQNVKSRGACPGPATPAPPLSSFSLAEAGEMAIYAYAAYANVPGGALDHLTPAEALSKLGIQGFEQDMAPDRFPLDEYALDPSLSQTSVAAFLGTDTPNRRVVLSFRGTVAPDLGCIVPSRPGCQLKDEIFNAELVDFPLDHGHRRMEDTPDEHAHVQVNKFFLAGLQAFKADTGKRTGLWPRLEALLAAHPDFRFAVTGHSLGGAMAMLAALDLVHSGVVDAQSLSLYTFGQPRTGNHAFAAMVDEMLPANVWRVVAASDPVPHVPLCTTNAEVDFPNDDIDESMQQCQAAGRTLRDCDACSATPAKTSDPVCRPAALPSIRSSPCNYQHAGREVWFPSGNFQGQVPETPAPTDGSTGYASGVPCGFRVCSPGTTTVHGEHTSWVEGEDYSCSGGLFTNGWSISDHTWGSTDDHSLYWATVPTGFCANPNADQQPTAQTQHTSGAGGDDRIVSAVLGGLLGF